MTTINLIIAGIGLLLSLYGVYIKQAVDKNQKYRAWCDLSNKFSCTAAFRSKYATALLLPNAVWGVLFYVLIMILDVYGFIQIIVYLSIIAVAISAALAYVSFAKLKSVCPVCSAIYLVNIGLLVQSINAAW